jgi:uncharacterized protein (TIGR02217 family)
MATFHEVRLPDCIEVGARGGPGFLTSVSSLYSGKEQRNGLWEVDRGEWDISYGIQTRDDALAVRDFFMARRGKLYGFRFKDWTNYRTEGTTQHPTLEVADQSETEFQLYYRYQDTGNFIYEKRIYKPVAATIQMYVDGVANAGFTVDDTTGRVTFTTPPDYGADITWTGEFDVPVRFDTDRLDIVINTHEVLTQPQIKIVELKL